MNKILSASALALSMLLIPVTGSAAYYPDDNGWDEIDRRAPRYQADDSTYVCYRSRMTMRDSMGRERARYRGCFVSERPCAMMGRNHFGKYADEYQAQNALDRCVSGRPRFID